MHCVGNEISSLKFENLLGLCKSTGKFVFRWISSSCRHLLHFWFLCLLSFDLLTCVGYLFILFYYYYLLLIFEGVLNYSCGMNYILDIMSPRLFSLVSRNHEDEWRAKVACLVRHSWYCFPDSMCITLTKFSLTINVIYGDVRHYVWSVISPFLWSTISFLCCMDVLLTALIISGACDF